MSIINCDRARRDGYNTQYTLFYYFFHRILSHLSIFLSPQQGHVEPMDPVKASCINNETKEKPTPM